MTTLTETAPDARFILSEANGQRSRETGTLTGAHLTAGTVLMDNGSGKLIAWLGGDESGGAQPAAGILLNDSDASAADLTVAYIARAAEVNHNLLTYPVGKSAATIESLGFLGIVSRP